MNTYKHIIFDLDHTLWDFDKNSAETLSQLFDTFCLQQKLNTTLSIFINYYKEINKQLWHLYNQHLISKEDLRVKRFQMLFEHFNYFDPSLASALDNEYISICPEKTHLIKGALNVLDILSNKYTLHILTNGFKETQERKLKACGINHYFKNMITSECSGYNKPHRKMFSFALNKANAHYKECIMVGDNLKTDIQGAKNVGMDQVFFNPHKTLHRFKTTHEVYNLKELLNIL